MKKIKFLHGFVLVLIVIFALFFIGNMYIIFFSSFMEPLDYLYEGFIFGYYTRFVGLFLSFWTFLGLLFVKKGLGITLKNGMFQSQSSRSFITAAKFFFISGILGGAFDVAIFIRAEGTAGVDSFAQNLLLIILAFVLYIIADIIKNGNELKIDNELTI